MLVDTLGQLLSVVIHPNEVQDRDGARLMLLQARRRFPFIETIFADGGLSGAESRARPSGDRIVAPDDREAKRRAQIRHSPKALDR